MAEYISFSSDAQVAGRVILSTFDAIGPGTTPFLEKYALTNIDPDGWYPQQTFLNALKEIINRTDGNFLDLVGVGLEIAKRSLFPPQVDDVEAGLLALDMAYQKNNHGAEHSNVGRYHIQKISDSQIDIVAENPFPCDMVYGVLYGTVRRFKRANRDYVIFHDNTLPCRKQGALTCTYHIEWKEQINPFDLML